MARDERGGRVNTGIYGDREVEGGHLLGMAVDFDGVRTEEPGAKAVGGEAEAEDARDVAPFLCDVRGQGEGDHDDGVEDGAVEDDEHMVWKSTTHLWTTMSCNGKITTCEGRLL